MNRTTIIPVELENGATLNIEARALGGERDVASRSGFKFAGVKDQVIGIAKAVFEPLQTVKPDKIELEFGLSFTLEAGKLTSLLVNGESTAALKITLSWEGKPPNKEAK